MSAQQHLCIYSYHTKLYNKSLHITSQDAWCPLKFVVTPSLIFILPYILIVLHAVFCFVIAICLTAFVNSQCLEVCQSDLNSWFLAVRQSHGSLYGEADWLWCVLPCLCS